MKPYYLWDGCFLITYVKNDRVRVIFIVKYTKMTCNVFFHVKVIVIWRVKKSNILWANEFLKYHFVCVLYWRLLLLNFSKLTMSIDDENDKWRVVWQIGTLTRYKGATRRMMNIMFILSDMNILLGKRFVFSFWNSASVYVNIENWTTSWWKSF